jgi:hypothetical protein
MVTRTLEWINETAIDEVDRSLDLTITWQSSNTEREMVTIFGASGLQSGTTTGLLCSERATAGRMTIPAWLLSAMLPSAEMDGMPLGYLVVANSPLDSASRVLVPGIDAAVLQYIEAKAKVVRFR